MVCYEGKMNKAKGKAFIYTYEYLHFVQLSLAVRYKN